MSELILNMYQSGAVRTAIYPGTMVYPTLGLCGEVGELIAVVTKDIGMGDCGDELDSIEKEVGDVLWYVANIAEDMSTLLSEVMGRENFAVCPEMWSNEEVLRELPIHAGVVAENIKKAIRDNDGDVSHARGKNILEALRCLVTWLERLCSWYGISLEECAQLNLDKLRSRKERGVIKGDGNDR
jgi:NTP pyrophosphatase (non-canonical NTP hydrolase)